MSSYKITSSELAGRMVVLILVINETDVPAFNSIANLPVINLYPAHNGSSRMDILFDVLTVVIENDESLTITHELSV
jgi:hypothetical protein